MNQVVNIQDELNDDRPTALDQLVSELNQVGKSQYAGVSFPVQTRLRADLYGMVDALSKQAGTSRNKIVNQLVEVGIQSTLELLTDEVVRKLQEAAGDCVFQAIEKNPIQEGGDL